MKGIPATAGAAIGAALLSQTTVRVVDAFSKKDCASYLQDLQAMDESKWQRIFNNAKEDSDALSSEVQYGLE